MSRKRISLMSLSDREFDGYCERMDQLPMWQFQERLESMSKRERKRYCGVKKPENEKILPISDLLRSFLVRCVETNYGRGGKFDVEAFVALRGMMGRNDG